MNLIIINPFAANLHEQLRLPEERAIQLELHVREVILAHIEKAKDGGNNGMVSNGLMLQDMVAYCTNMIEVVYVSSLHGAMMQRNKEVIPSPNTN